MLHTVEGQVVKLLKVASFYSNHLLLSLKYTRSITTLGQPGKEGDPSYPLSSKDCNDDKVSGFLFKIFDYSG